MAKGIRETWGQRLRFALSVGCVVALSEAAAAALLGIRELQFFGLQTLVVLLIAPALALLPLSRARRASLPWLLVGGLHLAGVALEEAGALSLTGALVLGLHALCAFALARVWERLAPGPPLLFALGLALVSQALLSASLLFPLEQSSRPDWLVPTGVLCTSVVPLLLGILAARVRVSIALAAASLIIVTGVAAHWPWTFETHALTRPYQSSPGGANVILIVMDATRADRMSVYGAERSTTPNLERFAQGATVYERAVSQGTWTLPGHASLFTGLYLKEHEADNDIDGVSLPLSPAAQTLAETMQADGYRTACFAANHGMFIEGFGLTQGFETKWSEPGLTKHLVFPALVRQLAHSLFGHAARKRIGALERNQFASAQEINQLALRWLDRRREPGFLFLNYMEVHSTFRRVPCAAPVFGDGVSWSHYDVPNYDAVMAGVEDPDPKWTARVRDWYDSSLACLDLHLGELFEELRARDLYDEALIIVTSDHGQMLGEERSFHHKSEAWEGLTHVPLLVKLPGQTEGRRCTQPVETADIARLVPDFLNGVTRDPCSLGERHAFAVSETRRTWDLAQAYPERWDRGYFVIVEGTHKYVQDSRGERWIVNLELGGDESRRPPTAEEHARFDELEAAWKLELGEPLIQRQGTQAERERRLKSLRDLGYVGED